MDRTRRQIQAARTKTTALVHSQLSRMARMNPKAPSPSWKSTDVKRVTIQPGPSTIQFSHAILKAAKTRATPAAALRGARMAL